jgi:hypothetical protein
MEQRAEPVSQEIRGHWQRQAAQLLFYLADRNWHLPAVTWTVSTDGNLCGWASPAIPPGDGREVLTVWRDTLELSQAWEVPGRDGRPGSMHASGNFGAISVSLAARVLPQDPGGPRPGDPGAFGRGYLLTRHCIPAVMALGQLLDVHAGLPAITWRVGPAGGLTGHVSATASPRGGTGVFTAWHHALLLDEPTRTAARLAATGDFTGQPVTVTLAMPARPGPEPARTLTARRPAARHMLAPGRSCAPAPTLPRPRPDSARPGPSQRP